MLSIVTIVGHLPAISHSIDIHLKLCAGGVGKPPREEKPQKPSMAQTHSEVAAQWHPIKNNGKQPTDFSAGSMERIVWICDHGCPSCGRPHEWEAEIARRTRPGMPTGCPICSGRKCCECSSLAAQRSDLMREWDWEANAELDPKQISLSSNRRVAWSCSRHGTWVTQVAGRVAGSGCPECANERKRGKRVPRGLLRDEHPELVKQLHPTKNAHIDLDMLTSGSHKRAVWVCNNCQDDPPGCPHPREWEAFIINRALLGSGCPYCSGRKVCPCKSLAQLVPEVAAQWHPTRNGDKQPDQYGPYSHHKVWWQHLCEQTGQLHEWQAVIGCRSISWELLQLIRCPHCYERVRGKLAGRRKASLVKR